MEIIQGAATKISKRKGKSDDPKKAAVKAQEKEDKAALKAQQKREKELLAAAEDILKVRKEKEEMRAKLQAIEAKEQAYVQFLEGKKRKQGTLEAVLSKKAKFMHNPFEVEKSKYNQRIFEVNNPFMEVIVTNNVAIKPPSFPDKVCDGQHMDEEALTTAIRVLLPPVALARMQYKNPRTELVGRHIHGLILLRLKLLTRPFRHKQQVLSEALEDLLLKLGGDVTVTEAEGSNSNESDILEVEGDGDGKIQNASDIMELLTKEKYDLKGLVYDTRLEITKQLVTVLMVECEWETLSIYKGAGYAVKDGIRNVLRGRMDPIYVQSWGKEKWRYAVIYPQRVIRVINGHVANIVPDCDPDEHAKLESLLQMKTRDLARDYLHPEHYSDNVYLQGVLHVVERKFDLPSKLGRPLTPEQLLFYEALLRIFVGNRVLSWTKEDVEKNVDLRLAEERREVDIAMNTTAYTALVDELLPQPPREGNVFAPQTWKTAPKTSKMSVKVLLQGVAVGRSVDLSKFSGYAELFQELQQLFQLEKPLGNPECGWQVAFVDPDGDMLLVGDNPWEEFCNICHKIMIQKMGGGVRVM